MGRESLLAYFRSRRQSAQDKMTDGQFAVVFNDMKARVAHYDGLIEKLS